MPKQNFNTNLSHLIYYLGHRHVRRVLLAHCASFRHKLCQQSQRPRLRGSIHNGTTRMSRCPFFRPLFVELSINDVDFAESNMCRCLAASCRVLSALVCWRSLTLSFSRSSTSECTSASSCSVSRTVSSFCQSFSAI